MDKIAEKESLIKYLEENGLYMVKKTDFEPLIEMSGRSYEDYPLDVYFWGGKYDPECLMQTVRVNLYSMFDDGIIYADSPELNGLVIVLPPGYTGINTLSFIWNGGFKIIYKQGIRNFIKMVNFESFAMNMRKKYTNNEDWYLYNLCVDKKSKGKKISSKLIKPLINYFKINKKMCYLETNWDRNVPIYEHFGFKVMEKTMVPDSNVEHYAMMFDGR